MKNPKKWMALALALCLTMPLLAACGEKEDGPAGSNTSSGVVGSVAPATLAPTATPPVAQTAKAVKVKADDGLNVRAEASTDGEVLGLAGNGDLLALLIEDEKNGWYQVSYEGKTAYVSAEYVSVQEVSLEEYNRLKAGAQEDGQDAPASSPTGSAASKAEGPGSSQGGKLDSEDGE